MAFDQKEYERLAQEEGLRSALDAAIVDVRKLEEYMSAHYTTAKMVDEISTYRGLLRRCRSLLLHCDKTQPDHVRDVRKMINEIEEAL